MTIKSVMPFGEYESLSLGELDEQKKIGWVDWKASPTEVLENVNALLHPLGHEVILLNYGRDDDYKFAIVPMGTA